jgi:hypothetical protein
LMLWRTSLANAAPSCMFFELGFSSAFGVNRKKRKVGAPASG